MRHSTIRPVLVGLLAAAGAAFQAPAAPLTFVDQEAHFFGRTTAHAVDDQGVYDGLDEYDVMVAPTSPLDRAESAAAAAASYATATAESRVATVVRSNNLVARASAEATAWRAGGMEARARATAWTTSLLHFSLAEESQLHLRGLEVNAMTLPFIGMVGPHGDVPLTQAPLSEEVRFDGLLPAGDYYLGLGVAYSFSDVAEGSQSHTGAGAAEVRLAVGLLGDGNGDGAVTGADFTIWSDYFGAQEAYFDQGDYNLDGRVTGADFTVWSDHFGQAPPARPTPEPDACVLAAAALGLLIAVRAR